MPLAIWLFDIGQDGALDVLWIKVRPSVADCHLAPSAPTAKGRLKGGVSTPNDENSLAEVDVRVQKGMGDVRQILPGYAQPVRGIHIALCQHHSASIIAPLAGAGSSPQDETIAAALHLGYWFVGMDMEIELFHDRPQIGQVVLGRNVLLMGALDGDTGYGDALGRAEEHSVAWPPRDRVSHLVCIELDVVDSGTFE